ncbi:UDP-N-acetylmuramyl pentapeptide phosphotransferase/UDP-N-acetylglucosamine-1-phosphate transferase [Loktanella sp. PT4BL]|jgi:UDP-N-acetylmuramyl pentapeptide phosphotransferase/UDP-N-acetylglucosamine-1-phosphate transferase|uniref:MraY family glycosyltransferase n=1 Tax=Loktanella sp. PT4BL TaxID=2135611 RepID=UPI000D761F02|nr:glycosyltransferase [Loktanella sp. PT4BL]PXW67937.1 UDP-N-acetylmuramyl pentapeptide phosphotransferase/UDP-N-acetylglucosamine-1-phosphate transferase [Loktanella sp. PT4BL]
MQSEVAPLFQYYQGYLALISFVGCLGIIALARVFPRLRGRGDDENAVQSMHSRPTPRIGGVAIFLALALSVIFAPTTIVQSYLGVIIATTLLFLVGLSEDLGFRVSPRRRLLAVCLASLIVIVLLGVWLPRIGVPYFDLLMQYWFIGVPFTLLITAGVANGFNLIDGVNGLAALTAIGSAVSIALISLQAGHATMVMLSMMLAAVVFGFFMVNFPFGLIFLGDAGAYTIGFVLCWFGIAILIFAPAVSAWAILLTLFWPLADTLFAMFRRSRANRDAMSPDRLHFHQLVMRGLEICFLGQKRRHIANPLTTLVLAPFVIAPQVCGVLLWNNNRAAFLAVLAFLAAFFGSYLVAMPSVRAFRQRLRET